MLDLTTGKEVVLAEELMGELQPKLSPDGTQVVYTDEKTRTGFIVKSSGGVPEKFCDRCILATDWMHGRGSHVLFETSTNQEPMALIDVRSHRRVDFIKSSNPKYFVHTGHFSPDDRWISFHF